MSFTRSLADLLTQMDLAFAAAALTVLAVIAVCTFVFAFERRKRKVGSPEVETPVYYGETLVPLIGVPAGGKTTALASLLEYVSGLNEVTGIECSGGVLKQHGQLIEHRVPNPTPVGGDDESAEWVRFEFADRSFRFQSYPGELLRNEKGGYNTAELLSKFDGPRHALVIVANPFTCNKTVAYRGVCDLIVALQTKQVGMPLSAACRTALRAVLGMTKPAPDLAKTLQSIDLKTGGRAQLERRERADDRRRYELMVDGHHLESTLLRQLEETARTEVHRKLLGLNVLRTLIRHASARPYVLLSHLDLKTFMPSVDDMAIRNVFNWLFENVTARPFAEQQIQAKSISVRLVEPNGDDTPIRVEKIDAQVGEALFNALRCDSVNAAA